MIKGHLRLVDLDPVHQEQHRKLFALGLEILPGVVSTVPTTDTLQLNTCALYESGSTRRLYFNLGGAIHYITFDA